MRNYEEKKLLPYSQKQLYEVVANVETYPEFLPWCLKTRILQREENGFTAETLIGFNIFRERFTSHVKTSPYERIDVTYLQGPFKHLENHWIFIPESADSCWVDFMINFEFRSHILERVVGLMFHEAVSRLIHAFENRLKQQYHPDKKI